MDKRVYEAMSTPCVNENELSIRSTITALLSITGNIDVVAKDVRTTLSSVLEPRKSEKCNDAAVPRDSRSCDVLIALEDLNLMLINIRDFLLNIMRDSQV